MWNKILDHLFGPEIEDFELKEEEQTIHILIVDDLHSLHELKRISPPRGVQVHYASTIFDAISKINSGKIQAVLTGDGIAHQETFDENLSKRFGDLVIFRMAKDMTKVNTFLLKPFEDKAYLQTLIQLRNLARFQPQKINKIKKIA